MAVSDNSKNNYLDRTYIGVVKAVEDGKFAGRVRVWIPEFDTRESDSEGWILCNYCSPFGGVTSRDKNSTSHFDLFDKTQTSYGMWMTPPDINNDVVVMFPSGDVGRAIWVGVVFKEYMNHSVPEAAYSENNKQFFGEGKKVPVTEYNKWDKTGDADDPIHPVRPYHETRFYGISEQGLISDEIRGITSSSSMRESPSQVFGINTPGPANPKTEGARTGGHSFIMDDGDKDGNDSYIGFKTKTGASIRIDDTNGLIYAINSKGTSWFQMDADGNVDVFGANSISLRSQGDFNVRADGDINLEAGQNVNIKAAQDTKEDGTVVTEGNGVGGDINMQAANNMNTLVDDNAMFTVTKGNVDIDVQTGNKKEHVKGNVDERFDSKKQETVGSTTGVKSSNYNLASSGSMEVKGSFHAGGSISSGGDVSSSSQSLDALFNHTHIYRPGPGSPSPTLPFGAPGAPTSASGPNAAQAKAVKPMVTTTSTNVLREFNGTITMNLNNDNVRASSSSSTIEIPDYWNRMTGDISSIVSRFPTFEPCPLHTKDDADS